MKTSFRFGRVVIAAAVLLSGVAAMAQVPQLLNYQGRIAVNGTNFTGIGLFKFVLLSASTNASVQATASGNVAYGFLVNIVVSKAGSGYSTPPAVSISDTTGSGASAYAQISGGVVTNIVVTSAGSGYSASPAVTVAAPPQQGVTTTFWSNDGTSNAGGQPVASVPLPVTKGLYSVMLGDTTLSNMVTLSASVFSNPGVWLRVWFNDGTAGFQQLTPDQRLAAVGYAIMAGTVADGSITAAKIAPGAIGSSQLAPNLTIPGTLTVSNLVINGEAVTGSTNYLIPSGTNIQTQAGGSYFITNSSATIILPAIANVGDIIKVQFACYYCSGSCQVLQNTGQRIVSSQLLNNYTKIVSSADASRLVLSAGMGLLLSTNSTANWMLQPTLEPWPTPYNYSALQMSSDGSHIYGGAGFNGYCGIVVSTDYGQSWIVNTNLSLNVASIRSIACSSNGVKAVATAWFDDFGGIYTSADSGSNWTLQTSAPTNAFWSSIATSADGTKLVAVAGWNGVGGGIYTSGNSGTNWTLQTSAPTNAWWYSVATSADGTKLVAVCSWNGSRGGIYTSANSGSNWTLQTGAPTNAYWYSIASSADGTKLIAGASSGVYSSVNSGATWMRQTNGLSSVYLSESILIASSGDGTKLAFPYGSQLYTSVNSGNTWTPCSTLSSEYLALFGVTSLGTSGGAIFTLINNQLTLVYLGNGMFSIADGNWPSVAY